MTPPHRGNTIETDETVPRRPGTRRHLGIMVAAEEGTVPIILPPDPLNTIHIAPFSQPPEFTPYSATSLIKSMERMGVLGGCLEVFGSLVCNERATGLGGRCQVAGSNNFLLIQFS